MITEKDVDEHMAELGLAFILNDAKHKYQRAALAFNDFIETLQIMVDLGTKEGMLNDKEPLWTLQWLIRDWTKKRDWLLALSERYEPYMKESAK